MMHRMPVALPFCRLVLGDGPAARVAADAAGGPEEQPRAQELAAAWAACSPELARRDVTLTWGADAPSGALADLLASRPAPERAALAAEALGAPPEEIARMLDTEPAAVGALLARAHLALAGTAAGADAASHRAALRALVDLEPEPPAGRRRAAATAAVTDAEGPRITPREALATLRTLGATRIEVSTAWGRALVATAVILIAGLSGYIAVSIIHSAQQAQDPQVVTGTPVGPLPPGVK
jgi:hypothetical protein